MGNESTAIHDLLSGLNRKAIPDDPDDDMIFAGSRRDPLAPPRMARGTDAPPHAAAAPVPTIHTPPAAPTIQLDIRSGHMVVPVPQAYVRQPVHALSLHHPALVRGGTHPIRGANKRLYAVAAGLFTIVVVLLGVYLAPVGKRTAAAATPHAKAPVVATVEPTKPAPAVESATPAPVVTPIEATKPAPVVTPIDVPDPAPAAAAPVAAVTAEAALPKDAVAPPAVVPASAFSAKYEPTVPTTTASAAVVTAPVAAPVAAAPVAAAPAPKAKSRHESARERRAAKRAAKASKARVAAAERVATPAPAPAALNGNGALEIASGSPREVWVDGRNSKRMTPLRVLLKPGKHTVTLFDKSTNKAKSFDVEIKPNATTKVAK